MKSKTVTDKVKGRFPNMGLKAKFLTATSLVIILLGLLTAIFVQRARTENIYHYLENYGASITRNLSANATDLILTQNIITLQNLIEEMLGNDDDILYIYLISLKGKVLAHTFEDGFPAGLKGINTPSPNQAYSSKLLYSEKGYIRDFAVPLFRNLGTSHVGISESRIRKTLSQTMWTISYITLTFLGIGIVLINIITGNVLKPLMLLTIGAKEIGSGKYGHRVEIETNDETGSLAASFNYMASKLQASIERLENEITERMEAEADLKIGLQELEDFYQMSVGRELKMVKLKKEIEKLKSELSQYKK